MTGLRLALTTEATGQGEVLGLNGNTLGMDSGQVSIFEEGHQVGLASLLKSKDGRGLEAEISLKVLSDFTNETLEGQLANQEIRAFLVLADFTEGNGTRPEAMRFLDTACRNGGGLLGSLLSRELLSWGFATSRLASSLLGAGHVGCFLTVCDAESWVWDWVWDH